jgi:hypothetical protein
MFFFQDKCPGKKVFCYHLQEGQKKGEKGEIRKKKLSFFLKMAQLGEQLPEEQQQQQQQPPPPTQAVLCSRGSLSELYDLVRRHPRGTEFTVNVPDLPRTEKIDSEVVPGEKYKLESIESVRCGPWSAIWVNCASLEDGDYFTFVLGVYGGSIAKFKIACQTISPDLEILVPGEEDDPYWTKRVQDGVFKESEWGTYGFDKPVIPSDYLYFELSHFTDEQNLVNFDWNETKLELTFEVLEAFVPVKSAGKRGPSSPEAEGAPKLKAPRTEEEDE